MIFHATRHARLARGRAARAGPTAIHPHPASHVARRGRDVDASARREGRGRGSIVQLSIEFEMTICRVRGLRGGSPAREGVNLTYEPTHSSLLLGSLIRHRCYSVTPLGRYLGNRHGEPSGPPTTTRVRKFNDDYSTRVRGTLLRHRGPSVLTSLHRQGLFSQKSWSHTRFVPRRHTTGACCLTAAIHRTGHVRDDLTHPVWPCCM